MRELCGMQVKTDRSSLKMRVTTSIFIAAMLVLFVYCLSAGAVFTSGIEYIDKNRNQKSENSLWTYICENESTCTRKKLAEGQERVSLETCNTMCATLQVWPKPTHVEINNKSSSTFNKNQVTIELLRAVDKVKDDLNTAAKIFMNNLPDVGESWIKDVDITSLRIQIIVNGSDTKLNMSTDESYGVSIINIENTVFAIVSAPTYFGARHGLETLSQLIWLDPVAKKLRIVHDVKIFDKPKNFPTEG
ncbi:hypothetical protein NQ317_015610 [Molorchus minor]|uniref:Beta-hexosaminidase eukaryotic type N-terminal domain-containing protein n=1 Tax=Molorchus minor TaxID=1323400 RepID=A0ABQ9JZI3_9CUCU|nr:hypothetical protein NQ317_015610 [Molorchus minor]